MRKFDHKSFHIYNDNDDNTDKDICIYTAHECTAPECTCADFAYYISHNESGTLCIKHT